MDEKQAFDEINGLLEDTDYPIKITSRSDIEDFLIDDDNRRFNQFEEIGRIFDDLVGRPSFDIDILMYLYQRKANRPRVLNEF